MILPQPKTRSEALALPIPTRYGASGSLVFIKEKWRVFKVEACDPAYKPAKLLIGYGDLDQVWKSAPDAAILKYAHDGRWKSGRFMPKWASRCQVELTKNVEIQRLHDITEQDLREEGVPASWDGWDGLGPDGVDPTVWDKLSWLEQWKTIWEPLHGAEGYGWDTNPWVYRISFRRVKLLSL